MNNPLISVCIPTYNRDSYLDDCLKSIVDQFSDETVFNNIEIVISDNASTDSTKSIIDKYTKLFPDKIKYFRNNENMGFDKNLLNVVEKSTGIYCLTFGDDDAFMPGCFSLLIKKIEQYKAPYFMLNCFGYDHTLTKKLSPKPNRDLSKDIVYNKLADFVKSISSYLDIVGNFGGMSIQLFSREMWLRFSRSPENIYVGTQTVHLFVLLNVFKDQPFVLIAEPVAKTRNDNMRWDTYPGLETHKKRAEMTIKSVLWISDKYNLMLNKKSVEHYIRRRAYVIYIKEIVKKILFVLHLRKK